MTAIAKILSQAKGECISCDKEKETHELCMDCVAKMVNESSLVTIMETLYFAEYFKNNFDYYDCNANGRVYKWIDVSKRVQPAMTMNQIFEQWKSK